MNMIERVARGIACDHYMWRFKLPDDARMVIDNVEDNWAIWSNEAKAAIAAMREPTEEMVEAAFGKHGNPNPFRTAWYAMIDAALKQEDEK